MHSVDKNVLIVEDEAVMLEALYDAFHLRGIPVLKAINGAEGLKVAIERCPEIILLDLLMPVMDGFTMLERLRRDSWGKNAKVMILTNFSSDEVRYKAAKYNVLDFLVKTDHGIEDIIARVKRVLV